jgi:hypothetical protein
LHAVTEAFLLGGFTHKATGHCTRRTPSRFAKRRIAAAPYQSWPKKTTSIMGAYIPA